MASSSKGYLPATRHPWPGLLFLLPLLLVYECGILWMGGAQPDILRPGADSWLHWGLETFGLHHAYWTPGLIVLVLLGWSWCCRKDRPDDIVGVCAGMGIESVLFALALWGLSRGLGPLLDNLGIKLQVPAHANEAAVQVISFLGAGIYEEVLFRLVLFSGLVWLLKQVGAGTLLALPFAAAASALIFSAAHHLGPYGEKFDAYAFLFRTLAGLYFTIVYQWRGFGIAVGAHACYDVVVGIVAA